MHSAVLNSEFLFLPQCSHSSDLGTLKGAGVGQHRKLGDRSHARPAFNLFTLSLALDRTHLVEVTPFT